MNVSKLLNREVSSKNISKERHHKHGNEAHSPVSPRVPRADRDGIISPKNVVVEVCISHSIIILEFIYSRI